MCGIFGYYNYKSKTFKVNKSSFHTLMNESYSRGKEASGVALLHLENKVSLIKSDLDGRNLLKSKEYKTFLKDLKSEVIVAAIGHSRLATHGTQLVHRNNQPVISLDKKIIGVHNGIITNPDDLWKLTGQKENAPILDTQSLIDYYSFLLESLPKENALKKLFITLEGSASLAMLDLCDSSLTLATNTGSLYYVTNPEKDSIYFASEKIFLLKILNKINTDEINITHLKPQTALIINRTSKKLISFNTNKADNIELSNHRYLKDNLSIKDYSSEGSKSNAVKLYTVTNSLQRLKKHDFDYKKIYSMKRCIKCILPLTTPFIEFDNNGVCNFCNEHEKITYKGTDVLRKMLAKYKKNDGKPNCLAAFSGGRDSSYGLHFLKEELGLEPLAYSYDWGMVTDIARKNQARILGKLGVEHIVVSADITKKRRHIKKNIQAWMKDPHLGMVPLFMEGDKQCEFYADQIMKKYDINLMFFFRGNELEKDEFKTGHCGVKDADPGGVIHNLALKKKVKLLSFYTSRYLKNPAYFNSSFFDTSLGFFSTYIQPHNYLYLWHYVPWEEKTIVDTLMNDYNWELSTETDQTWRTDDGTSAFYNYIYYQVQGYTENDSFRSRQIRENLLDREAALELVHSENKPRYGALKWYFDNVGLDGDEVLTVVDNIKKLY